MIELYQLEQFVAVARYGTLSKAAEELHTSQPVLSRTMQKLEEELQVQLFERQKNKLTFNQNGEISGTMCGKGIGGSPAHGGTGAGL